MKMWEFKTRRFTVQWLIEEDTLDTAGMDRAQAQECRDNVRSGDWECFQSEIRVVHRTTRTELGAAYLGGSIYANPAEFRDHIGIKQTGYGSYFSQMVREACAEARKNFPGLQKKALLVQQELLATQLRQEVRHAA